MPNPIRRVVTGHNSAGRATISIDEMMSPIAVDSGDACFVKAWSTSTSPADNNDEFDGSRRETGLTCPGGTVLRVVDLAPGKRSPMHRTQSIDYGIVIDGKIDMELDDGKTVSLRAGDLIIQRGTIHAWINRSSEWCRMVFVLIDAKPID